MVSLLRKAVPGQLPYTAAMMAGSINLRVLEDYHDYNKGPFSHQLSVEQHLMRGPPSSVVTNGEIQKYLTLRLELTDGLSEFTGHVFVGSTLIAFRHDERVVDR